MKEFGAVLVRLLDESGIFERPQWAEFLGVSEDVLNEWCKGEGLPSPEQLRSLLDHLWRCSGVPTELLKVWEDFAGLPRLKVLYVVGGRTKTFNVSFAEYEMSPAAAALLGMLTTFPRSKREEVWQKILRAKDA